MATILEAKAVISAQDKTGAVFDSIAKKLNGLAKNGKAAAAVDQLSQAMGRARSQLVAIDKFNSSRGATFTSWQKWREAEKSVSSLARAISAVDKPSKEMEKNFAATQRAATAASKAYERQRDTLRENRRAMVDAGVPVGKQAAHQKQLLQSVAAANGAIERQERLQARSETRRLALAGALAAGAAATAHGVKAGGKAVLHTYREFDNERRFGKAVMGLTDEEQKPLVDQAIHMGATTKFNDIQVLEAQRELAARGVQKNTVLGMMQPAGALGMALDLKLPDAVKQMEGAIFGFKKKIDTEADALTSARRTADLQVKAAKLSGMTPEDITQAYKYGATPARMAGLSEETLLAFAGVAKKANMGGDEAGVAFRALVASMQSPTAGARTALLANGLNFKNYQRSPDSIAVDPFVENVAAKYGVNLNKDARKRLGSIFGNKDILSDPAKFAPAVMSALGDTLGGNDAKSKKSIAGEANRYRNAALGAIDSNAFFGDLLKKLPGNLPLANALFGAKQGARIATATDPEAITKILNELVHNSDGFADKIAGERMAGFDGAVSRFEGAIKNLETAIGRGFDNDGKGGALSKMTGWGASATQWLAEQNPMMLAGGALAGGGVAMAGAAAAGWKFLQIMTAGPALNTAAVALNGAAAALTAAAGGGAVKAGAAAVTGATATTAATGGGVFGAVAGRFATAGAAAVPYLPYAAIAAGAAAVLKLAVPDSDVGTSSGDRLSKYRGGSLTDARRRAYNADRERLGIEPLNDPSNEAIRSSVTGAAAGGAGVQNVKAEVVGNATLETTVTVSPSPDFLAKVDQRVNNAINAFKASGAAATGTAGSTGRSMPEAGAPQ